MDLLSFVRTMGALGVVLGMLAGALWFVKRYNIRLPGSMAPRAGKRVAVVERTGIDARRSVALIRRDGREHLILLAPEGNLVIESAIVTDDIDRAAIEAQAAEAEARAVAAQAAATQAQESFRDLVSGVLERSSSVREKVGTAITRASAAASARKNPARGFVSSLPVVTEGAESTLETCASGPLGPEPAVLDLNTPGGNRKPVLPHVDQDLGRPSFAQTLDAEMNERGSDVVGAAEPTTAAEDRLAAAARRVSQVRNVKKRGLSHLASNENSTAAVAGADAEALAAAARAIAAQAKETCRERESAERSALIREIFSTAVEQPSVAAGAEQPLSPVCRAPQPASSPVLAGRTRAEIAAAAGAAIATAREKAKDLMSDLADQWELIRERIGSAVERAKASHAAGSSAVPDLAPAPAKRKPALLKVVDAQGNVVTQGTPDA